ncbi:MAG: hypothetical protein B7Z69_07430 [Actinobacteria bacterium 21-73-9]|nr:MAG: hypothetical protein B7Z69_07430 [Actinobacteria bacterium 21-73-9]
MVPRASSMPVMSPRSIAHKTGCSRAAAPKGQLSEVTDGETPSRSARAAKPWAVRSPAIEAIASRTLFAESWDPHVSTRVRPYS